MLQAIVPFLSQECAFGKEFWKLLQFAHNGSCSQPVSLPSSAVLQGELIHAIETGAAALVAAHAEHVELAEQVGSGEGAVAGHGIVDC
jgi:hypothetical protein